MEREVPNEAVHGSEHPSHSDAHVMAGSHMGPHERAHPGPAVYIRIAVILAIITMVEVTVYYIPAMGPVLVPTLLVLSATKFALVAMFFMHLRFDARLFSGFFVGGIILTSAVLIALMLLFRTLFR